ncbi:MAG: DNA alkylation repair protein [Chlorobiaceae bacterium]|nr:DNA alkylation repair protein [Chlorobiaceae bacterium]
METTIGHIQSKLNALADERDAGILQWFFKTGPGQYGEGDRFRGIRVPLLRKLCREFPQAGLHDAVSLLASPWHEDRLLALLILIERYRKADEPGRESIYGIYCAQAARINNWDLVDISAPHIVGRHLQERDRSALYRFAGSASLWERRIAIVSTFHFIRQDELIDTLAIAEALLDDPEELIHKATGWMLREVGKRDRPLLEAFLTRLGPRMPRTMLRYAIERFPEQLRQKYLKGKV